MPDLQACNFSLTGGPLHGNGTPRNYPLERQEIPPVAAPDIGTKRICPSCTAKFYDLSKKPIVCPKCAFSFTAETIVKMRRPRSTASLIKDADEGPVRAKEALDDTEDAEASEGAEDEEAEAEEEIKEVALDDEAIADPDLVEDEDAEDTDDKPEVVGDEVDLEEIEAEDDSDDEEDDALIENVDDEDDVGGIIDKGDLDKE